MEVVGEMVEISAVASKVSDGASVAKLASNAVKSSADALTLDDTAAEGRAQEDSSRKEIDTVSRDPVEDSRDTEDSEEAPNVDVETTSDADGSLLPLPMLVKAISEEQGHEKHREEESFSDDTTEDTTNVSKTSSDELDELLNESGDDDSQNSSPKEVATTSPKKAGIFKRFSRYTKRVLLKVPSTNGGEGPTEKVEVPSVAKEQASMNESEYWDSITAFPKQMLGKESTTNQSFPVFLAHTIVDDVANGISYLKEAGIEVAATVIDDDSKSDTSGHSDVSDQAGIETAATVIDDDSKSDTSGNSDVSDHDHWLDESVSVPDMTALLHMSLKSFGQDQDSAEQGNVTSTNVEEFHDSITKDALDQANGEKASQGDQRSVANGLSWITSMPSMVSNLQTAVTELIAKENDTDKDAVNGYETSVKEDDKEKLQEAQHCNSKEWSWLSYMPTLKSYFSSQKTSETDQEGKHSINTVKSSEEITDDVLQANESDSKDWWSWFTPIPPNVTEKPKTNQVYCDVWESLEWINDASELHAKEPEPTDSTSLFASMPTMTSVSDLMPTQMNRESVASLIVTNNEKQLQETETNESSGWSWLPSMPNMAFFFNPFKPTDKSRDVDNSNDAKDTTEGNGNEESQNMNASDESAWEAWLVSPSFMSSPGVDEDPKEASDDAVSQATLSHPVKGESVTFMPNMNTFTGFFKGFGLDRKSVEEKEGANDVSSTMTNEDRKEVTTLTSDTESNNEALIDICDALEETNHEENVSAKEETIEREDSNQGEASQGGLSGSLEWSSWLPPIPNVSSFLAATNTKKLNDSQNTKDASMDINNENDLRAAPVTLNRANERCLVYSPQSWMKSSHGNSLKTAKRLVKSLRQDLPSQGSDFDSESTTSTDSPSVILVRLKEKQRSWKMKKSQKKKSNESSKSPKAKKYECSSSSGLQVVTMPVE